MQCHYKKKKKKKTRYPVHVWHSCQLWLRSPGQYVTVTLLTEMCGSLALTTSLSGCPHRPTRLAFFFDWAGMQMIGLRVMTFGLLKSFPS